MFKIISTLLFPTALSAATLTFDRPTAVESATGLTGGDTLFDAAAYGHDGGLGGYALDAHSGTWTITLDLTSGTLTAADLGGSPTASGTLAWNLTYDVDPNGPGTNSTFTHTLTVLRNAASLATNTQTRAITYTLGVPTPQEYTNTWATSTSTTLTAGDTLTTRLTITGTDANLGLQLRDGLTGSFLAPAPNTMTITPIPEPAAPLHTALATLALTIRRRRSA